MKTIDTTPGELPLEYASTHQNPQWRAESWRTMDSLAGTYGGPLRHPKARDLEKIKPPETHPFKRNYEF